MKEEDDGTSACESYEARWCHIYGTAFAINVDCPEDVDTVIESIRQAGGKVTKEPSDAFWGGRTAYFLDPEFNAWEVAWNPASVFDDRGAMIDF